MTPPRLPPQTLRASLFPTTHPMHQIRTAIRHSLARATVTIFDLEIPIVPLLCVTFRRLSDALHWSNHVAVHNPANPVIVLDERGEIVSATSSNPHNTDLASKSARSLWNRAVPRTTPTKQIQQDLPLDKPSPTPAPNHSAGEPTSVANHSASQPTP